MRKEKSVVMFVVIVHDMDFANKIKIHFDKFLMEKKSEDEEILKKKQSEEEKLKHRKFDPSNFKMFCVREIDQLDLLLTNPTLEFDRKSAGKPVFILPKKEETERINYIIFIGARPNESLLTTNDCEKVLKKNGAKLTLVHKFPEKISLKKLDPSTTNDDQFVPANKLEKDNEFLVWNRFFNDSISSIGKQLAFEKKNEISTPEKKIKLSTPTGEMSLEEVPSRH